MSDQPHLLSAIVGARASAIGSASAKSRRRPVTVLGVLDFHQGPQYFTVTVDQGVVIPCVLVAGDPAPVQQLNGKRAAVSGRAVWSVAGELLRIEVENVRDGAD